MNVVTASPAENFAPKDYASDQEVRWCPGCGDYAIVKAVRRTLADLAVSPENTVFVSGIGCAGRFPYYMATYGFHTIHGRAPAMPEMNTGQLLMLLRSRYLTPAVGINKVTGRPFKIREIEDAIRARLEN